MRISVTLQRACMYIYMYSWYSLINSKNLDLPLPHGAKIPIVDGVLNSGFSIMPSTN